MLFLFQGRQGVITLHKTIYCAVGQSTFFWFVASYLGFFPWSSYSYKNFSFKFLFTICIGNSMISSDIWHK